MLLIIYLFWTCKFLQLCTPSRLPISFSDTRLSESHHSAANEMDNHLYIYGFVCICNFDCDPFCMCMLSFFCTFMLVILFALIVRLFPHRSLWISLHAYFVYNNFWACKFIHDPLLNDILWFLFALVSLLWFLVCFWISEFDYAISCALVTCFWSFLCMLTFFSFSFITSALM